MSEHQPIVLVIVDGWGLTPIWGGNAISMGNPKTLNLLWRKFPHLVLNSFKKIAGSYRMVGNSVIGHSSIGAGKIVFQDLERISQSIQDKSFYQNQRLVAACKHANDYSSSLHLIGLISDGGVHGHIDHIKALLLLAKNHSLDKVYLHAILDGIDSDSDAGLKFLAHLEEFISKNNLGQIASIIGRDYIMDRDENWERIKFSLRALTGDKAQRAASATSALANYYRANIPDHAVPPTIIAPRNSKIGRIEENDAVIISNYRADRAQELVIALLGFHKLAGLNLPQHLKLTAFTSYNLPESIEKNFTIAFPQEKIANTLGRAISDANLRQFRIAESEKQHHISSFFNCGSPELLPGEKRVIIDSFDAADYLKHPEMKAKEITDKLISTISSKDYNFILVNYANVDSLAHTGEIGATAEAVACVDEQIKRVFAAVMAVDGTLIITADHGNAEQMVQTASARDRETFHTLNPVPFIFCRKDLELAQPASEGEELLSKMISTNHSLADIAPTILNLMGLSVPSNMEGEDLGKYLIRSRDE